MKSTAVLSMPFTVLLPALLIFSNSFSLTCIKDDTTVPPGNAVSRTSVWELDELLQPEWVITRREHPRQLMKKKTGRQLINQQKSTTGSFGTFSCYWIKK